MKKTTITILLTILLILLCINTVNAEDNNLNITDNNLTNLEINDTLTETVNHSHSQASELLNPPVKAATITASGGTFTDLQTVLSTASSGDTISFTGDYTYNSATDSGIQTSGISLSNLNLVFEGNGHTLDGLGVATLFDISDSSITFKNLNFINFYRNGNGGVISASNSNFVLSGVVARDISSAWGGVIYSSSSSYITVSNSQFFDMVSSNGGIVYVDTLNGDFDISNSVFEGFTAGGGTIIQAGTINGNLHILGSVFKDIISSSGNGGILAANDFSGDFIIDNCDFKNFNVAAAGGIVLVINGGSGDFNISNSHFLNFTVSGGGIVQYQYTFDGNFNFFNSTFKDINLTSGGGGIFAIGSSTPVGMVIDNCSFVNIIVPGWGGIAYIKGGFNVFNISNSIFDGISGAYSSFCTEGGVIGDISFINSNFTNIYGGGSGVIQVEGNVGGDFIIINSTFNSFSSGGTGGVFVLNNGLNGDLIINDSNFTNFKAGVNAGVGWINGNVRNITISNSNFFNGTSTNHAGVFYLNGVLSDSIRVLYSNFSNFVVNSNGGYSGLIYLSNGIGRDVEVVGSRFENVTSGSAGGIICTYYGVGGNVSFINSSFNNVSSSQEGGIFYANNIVGDFNISTCNFSNFRTGNSGGIARVKGNIEGDINIKDSVFVNGTSVNHAGVIYVDGALSGSIRVLYSNFSNFVVNSNGGYSGLIYLSNGIGRDVEVVGSRFENVTSGSAGGIICTYYGVGGNVSFTNSSFNNISTNPTGGIFYANSIAGDFNISNCNFSNYKTGSSGAFAWINGNVGGDVNVIDSVFVNATSQVHGGSIYIQGNLAGNFIVNNSNFTNFLMINSASNYYGGVFYVNKGINLNFIVVNSHFMNITSGGSGGVLATEADVVGNVSFINSTFIDVSSNQNGGIFYANNIGGNFNISNCNFSNYKAGNSGGIALINGNIGGDVNIEDSVFVNGTSQYCGGIFYISGNLAGNFIVNNSNITGCLMINSASNYYGGVFYVNKGINLNFIVVDSHFENISAGGSGGILGTEATVVGNVSFINSTFENVSSKQRGGIFYANVVDGYFVVLNSSFNEISSNSYAGAFYVNGNVGGDFNITDSNFSNYKSGDSGAISWIQNDLGGDFIIRNSNFINGTSGRHAGVMYMRGNYGANIGVYSSNFSNIIVTANGGYGGLIYTDNNVYGSIEVLDSNFENVTSGCAGGIVSIYRTVSGNVTFNNSTFKNITTDPQGGVLYLGTVNEAVRIFNCSMFNITSNSQGGVVYINSGVNDLIIQNSSFINITANSYSFVYASTNNAKINNNVIIVNDLSKSAVYANGDLNENWWGLNEPNFNTLITSSDKPETWVVMGFVNTTPVNTGASPTKLLVSLNTLYNITSKSFSSLNQDLPINRTVFYNSTISSASFTKNNINFLDNVNNSVSYSTIPSSWLITATIDYQTLPLGPGSVNLNITVSKDPVHLYEVMNYTLSVSTDFSFTNLSIYFNSSFIYIGSSGYGYYNSSTNTWLVYDVNSTTPRNITITVRVPYNQSLVNKTVTTRINTTGFISLNYLNPITAEAEVNVTVLNITGGSYTLLQALIDNTPENGTLNLPLNITYDPDTDGWLQTGMRINKTMTLNGDGYTISGLNQARIFLITGNNVTIDNLIYTNGTALANTLRSGTEGAAIASCGDNLTLTNSIFKNGYSNDRAAAILIVGTPNGYQYTRTYIDNCTFINNTCPDFLINAEGNEIYINHCIFENNSMSGQTIWIRTIGNVTNSVFVNNNNRAIQNGNNQAYIENNWYGTNTPNFNSLITGKWPETYVIMEFTNTTPINYTTGTSNLQVTLNTVFNMTDNSTTTLIGGLPTRTVYFNWTHGNVTPNVTNISGSVNVDFDYLAYPNMCNWTINATIDNQMLWIGGADIGISINSTSNPIDDGKNLTFYVSVVNNGPMNSTDINATIYLPLSGFNILNITPSKGIFNITTGIWEIGNLSAGENVTLEVNGTLADPGPYLVWNATVNYGSEYDYNHTNNTFISNITVNQLVDLEITKNISDAHPDTRDNVTYTLTVHNYGPSTATNVTVFDNLSSHLVFINYTSTNGTYNETTGIWFIDNITPNSTEILNITVLINQSGITENFANVSCIHNDTNWTNNYANVTFETAPLSDLWVTIDMDPQTSNFITFHIQAGNNGIEPANGTIVELNISNLMVYFNHTNDGGVYNCATAVWDIGYIGVNETVNLTLIVQLNFPAGLNRTNITTRVNITSWSTDLYPENNTDNVTFEAEIFGNFRLLQYLVDLQPANTVFVLPRSFAYDPINDAFIDGVDTYDLINGVSIYKNLTIVNPDGYTIGGFGMARCLNITAPNTILDGLKIADGYSPLGAGLNIPASNVQVLRSNFTNNVLWGDYGGAIFVSGANVLIQDNYFSRNNASKLGGAIGAMGATNLRILNNTFINNTAKSDDMSGGAIGILSSTATVNTNVFLDNNATSSAHIGSAIFTNNSSVNLEANWFGNNTPDMVTDELVYGSKPETWIILDWEIVNPNMTGVELNVVFVLYNSTSGEKTPINYGLPYRNLKVTSRDPTLSWYNTTYTGNNSVNYTYNVLIPTCQINATVDYETITLEFNTLLNVYKTLVNDTIWFGDDLIYNITIVNYGPHDTSILNLTDFLPSDLTINSITPSIGTVTNDTDNIYWIVSVPAGVNATLIINATPTVEGNYTNNITINTSTHLDYFINGTNKSVFGQVLSLSDLEVNLTIKTPPYYVGGEIVYNLRVANYGPSTAYNIVVNMPVSSGLTYLYQDWPGTYSQATGIWNISSLTPGDILDINITFRINSQGWYNQTVNITSDSVDNNISNNNKTVSFNVTSQVDLVLNMTINKNETLYGDNSVYVTLSVVNLGPGPADNVTVFTYFAGLGYLSAYGYGYFINDTPTAGRWLIGTLGVNITRTITLRFVASNVGNFTITGRANNTYNDSNWTNNYANVSISVLKYADLRITKAVSSSVVHVGDNITYTITVTNLAGFTADNVTVIDILDSRLYYDNNNPDYNGTDWFVGTVNVGETKTLTFNVTVTGNGTIWNNATVNGSLNDSNPNNNHVSISIFSGSLVSDLKITKTVNNTTPFLDENITYTITVTNLAGYIAENVTVYDPLPGVLVYDGNNPNFNGTEWFVGNLSVGETKNITFTVTVNGIGRIWNNVTVNSSLLDPNPNDNHDEVPIDVPFDGDLRISLSVIPNPPQANNPFIINVTVENFDTEPNSNVMVDFLLPPSLTYINSTCMGSYNPITGKWNIGYLPASTKVNLEIWVSPAVIGNVTIEGNVSGSVTDINPGNNRANLTFDIVPAFDLTITKNASNYTIYDGDTISFDISVWNNGPFVANNVKITDYLPYGLVYLFDNSSGVYHNNNHTVDWTLPYLNNGDNITIHLIARVQGPGLSFDNKVYVSAYGTDLNISDNTAYSGIVNVTQVNDLEIILTASKVVDIDLDEIITFYVTVVNHGPSNASGVIADFLLPTGLTYVSDNGTGFYIPSNGTWYIGHLANGTNITLEVKVNLTSGGKYTLNATVNGSYYDNDTTNNIAFLNISSLSLFDLNITAFWNLTNNTMFWNDLAEYTAIIHNNGTDNATNVTVELVVPGVTYVSHTGPGTLNNVTLVWNVGNLTVGEYKNITIIFNATSLGFFNTTGNITGYGHDTNISNNNYTLNLTVLPVVDLVMTNITVNTTVTCVDGLLEFNVTVFNKGPCNATNTTILGLLPTGWMVVGGMTMGNIPVNSSEVFTIIVNASTVGNYSVGFNATINGRDLNITDNWMYFENITVIYACDLMITIKSNTNSIPTGDIVVYTITVSNLDWRTAHNVSANVTIPAGLSLHHYYLASGEYNSSNGTWTIGNMSYRNSTTLFLFCTVDTVGDIEFWVNVSGDDYDFHLWNNNDTVNITGTMGLDLNISVSVDNSTPYTGDNITFTVVVENIGLVDASGVWVDIGIPVGFIKPWSTDLNFTGSSYYIGNLSIGNIKTFNFTVTPIWLVNGTFNFSVGANRVDYNLSNNFANLTICPIGATDLQINISCNNINPMVDEIVTYTITIHNNGTVDANNVMVYNNLPYSTVYATSTPTYYPSSHLWIITNLSAGTSETLNITINHTIPGIFNYTVNITGDIIDTNPTNNLDNITVTVSDYPDLITYFTVNSTTTLDENILNFTITIFNNGTFNYTNVKVYTNLPSTNTYTNSSLFDTNLGVWDVGNLTGYENKTINLLVNLTQIGNFTFWANSTSKESDKNLSNNNQSLNITVYADYDLEVNIFVNNNTPYFGDSVIFTINVTNYGPSTAHNISVLNNIYGTLLNLTKGTYTTNVWAFESLSSNETQTLNIKYAPTSAGISTYTVNITSNYSFFDRNTTNNYDNITLNISNAVDLIITITTNTTIANKTDLILYTVTVYNNGSSMANNVLVESDNLFDDILTYTLTGGLLSTNNWNISTIPAYGNVTLNITKLLNKTTTTIVNVTSNDLELDNSTNTDNVTVTVLKVSDLLVTITVNNTNPYLSENVTFTVTVYNLGEDTADNVTVYLDLPYSTSYSDVYMYDSLQGILNVGTLENNTNKTLNITLSLNFTGLITFNATVNSSNIDPNKTNNYDNVTLNITSLMDLSINITINTTNVLHVGDTVSFIVEVRNNGPADATGVNAYLNLPGSIQSITQGGYTAGVWSIGTLLKDQNAKLVLTRNLTIADAKEYNINVTSPDTDKNTDNNNASLNLSIVPSSDLEIKITSSNTTVNIGEVLVYNVTVTNSGPNNMSSGIVNITLPNLFNITSNMSTNGIFNGTHWILTNLNAGENATLLIYGNYTDGGNHTITVFVNSTNYDRNMTNNYDNVSVFVNHACDLTVNFTSNLYYNLDGTITFNITITNKGPGKAENITIHTNLDNTNDYNNTIGYFDTLQNIWYIDNLSPGQTETLIINTTILTDYLYFANATTDTPDLNISDNIKFLNLTLTPLADLSINITMNNSNPHIGESVTFSVTVTNNGPCNATRVIVYTSLPASSDYLISKGLYDTLNGNWSIGNLSTGEIVTLNLTINITSLGDYIYNVNVTGSVNDTNTSNNNDTINFTVLPTADLVINISLNQSSFTVGDNVTFTITVTNNGPSDAENLTVNIILPAGFIPDVSTTEWNITSLNNGTNITLNLTGILTTNGTQEFKANVTSDTFDNDTSNNQDTLIFNVDNLVDLEISITSNSTLVYAGEFINLLINLTNHGPGNAHNILVNTSVISATSTKNTGYYDTNTGYWFVETLNANTTEILNLTLRITENTTFNSTLNTTSIDSNLSNNNASINITVLPLADLNITVKVSSLNLYFDEEITYEITVVNNGYTTAENVTVNTNLNNTGFNFISTNSSNYDDLTGLWNIGNLSHNQTATLILKYKTTATGNINHTFTVNTTTYETNLADNSLNLTIYVNNSIKPTEGMVDLVINITVNNSLPNINSTITFNVTIFNNGSVEAHNLTINNTLPVGFTPVGTYTGAWNISNLSAYNTYSFTFTVNVTSYGSFVDNVTVDCSEWDINPTNNRANQLIIIKESGSEYLDLSINVTREGNLTLGETFTYNITVTNHGPQDAIDVNATIGLFDGLTVINSTSNDYNETLSLWNVGNLSSGSSKTLTLTVNITKTGSYTNVFIVWSGETDKNPQNNLQLDAFTINNTYVDVNVKITANRTYGNVNETILFTVTVTNPSSNPATDVNVTLDIPLEIVTFPSSDNTSYYIGELNSTQTVTFNFTAKINITNTVIVTANVTINETDHNLIDNVDTILITPFNGNNNGVADLTVNITTSLLNLTTGNMEVNQYPEYGDVPYFTVWVTNHGPDNATNVKVPLTVPNGCSIMAQDAYWDNTTESFILSNLAVNETKKLEVSMLIETTDVLLINATASCDQLDPNITDNTATISMYPFIPEPKCDLNVTVKVIGNEFFANSTVTFNITIRNDGQDIAYNVTVRNTVPAGLILRNITTYDTYTLNGDGWDIPQILPGASMQFLVAYNITKKGLYQTTVNVNSTIQDTDPTSNGMGVAFYAGEAEPPRREVNTRLNTPTVTTTAGKVQLAGGDWTFVGTLKFANNTAAPSSYTNFAGQTLYANVTDDAGVTRTYVSSTVTGSDGKATFIVPHADVGAGGTKFRIVIWYAGEKTSDDYYLPCVSSPKTNIKVVP